MSARIKHWTVRRSQRRVAGYWEVRNSRGVVAIVYTDEIDAKLMAAAPKLVVTVKRLVKAFSDGEYTTASQIAALVKAQKLIGKVQA